jgi:hypothetical protein
MSCRLLASSNDGPSGMEEEDVHKYMVAEVFIF